jgi:SAM-dependent methyltransferase
MDAGVKTKSYRFFYAERCNMCKSGPKYQVLMGRRLDRPQGLRPSRKPGIAVSVFRCRVCSLMYPDPMPIPENIEQHYDIEPGDYWHEAYFKIDPGYLGDQIKRFTSLTGRLPQESTALDIGAGIGKGMKALGQAGFGTYGIEPSPSFRSAAIERMGISNERLALTSLENADFPQGSFDFINFAAVLEHLTDPAEALRKAVGWLTPGGLMYVEVPSSAFLLTRLVRLYYRLTGTDYVINTSPLHPPYHLYEFGVESFRKNGNRAGYAVAFHEYYPCAAYMPRVLIKPFNRIMSATNTGMQLAVWLRRNTTADGDKAS